MTLLDTSTLRKTRELESAGQGALSPGTEYLRCTCTASMVEDHSGLLYTVRGKVISMVSTEAPVKGLSNETFSRIMYMVCRHYLGSQKMFAMAFATIHTYLGKITSVEIDELHENTRSCCSYTYTLIQHRSRCK
jgi:hypothetical protein